MTTTNPLQGKLIFPFVARPNGGKGTQTRVLSQRYNLPTFDMGASFRDIFSGKDPEMKAEIDKHKATMEAGGLLPDDVVAMVFKKYFENFAAKHPQAPGFIVDGFPRTIGQAQELVNLAKQWGAKIGKVFYLDVSRTTVEKRALGRRVCSTDESHVYNINEPKFAPKNSKTDAAGNTIWLCDHDNAELIVRKDDLNVQKRLDEYDKLTDPMIQHYRQGSDLVEVNGEQPADKVTQQLEAALQPILGLSPTS